MRAGHTNVQERGGWVQECGGCRTPKNTVVLLNLSLTWLVFIMAPWQDATDMSWRKKMRLTLKYSRTHANLLHLPIWFRDNHISIYAPQLPLVKYSYVPKLDPVYLSSSVISCHKAKPPHNKQQKAKPHHVHRPRTTTPSPS